MNKGALWRSIQEPPKVEIEHPVHLSRQQSRVECVQRLVLASPRPEPVREAEKVRFVNGVQHLDRCTILSSSAGTPSGRCRPSVFDIYTLRTGFARYAPRCRRFSRMTLPC